MRSSEIKKALLEMNLDKTTHLVKEALSSGDDPSSIIDKLRKGMDEIGKRFEKGEFFLSDLIMGGEIMKEAMNVLKPHIKKALAGAKKGEVILGTIEGDLHDIGKNIVKVILESRGYIIFDLGIDVSPIEFVNKVMEVKAKVVGISTLLSVSVPNTEKVVKGLRDAGVRARVKIIVGGAAVKPEDVEKYGLDAAVNDVMEGVSIIDNWYSSTR